MNSNQQATLNQAIKLLQSLMSGAGTSQGSAMTEIPIPDYDTQIQQFYKLGHGLQPEIQQLTDLYKKASTTMRSIMSYSQACKKYSPQQQQKLKNIFISLSNDVEGIIKKNPKYLDHCKAIKEILSATFWVFVTTPEYIIKGAVQGADFNALKFQKLKVKQHNDWWASITGAGKILEKWVMKNYPMGLSFNFKGQDKWDNIISGTSSTTVTKPTEQKPQTNSQNAPQQVKPTTVKAPKKELIGLNWQIRYFDNQPITLGEEVQMKHGIFIQNCNNCQIKIESKFKSLNLSKCENVSLVIKSCVSGVQIMNCKSLNVMIKEKTPSLSVDKSDKVNLILNSNCLDIDVVSCKASQLNVTIEQNGNQSKPYLISDQLITKWNPQKKKFQTAVYDKFL